MIPVIKRHEDNCVIDQSEGHNSLGQSSDVERYNIPWRQIQLSLPGFEDT